MNKRLAVATAVGSILAAGLQHDPAAAGAQKPKGQTSFATFTKLPSLGSNAEARGVNDAGTVVVGHSFDRAGFMYPVKWTLQSNGTWSISKLASPPPAPGSAQARGIDNFGNVTGAGTNPPRRPVYWPAGGGYSELGCDGAIAETLAISADGQVIVGFAGALPAAWSPAAPCTEYLPVFEGGSGMARAVSADGITIGGLATQQQLSVPVRWILTDGQRQLQQLDARSGSARGANESGDLAGAVTVACRLAEGCNRAVIWYASGMVTQLATLGGDHSLATDINSQGEVVGLSTPSQGGYTAFFWSEASGMLQIPAAKFAVANAVSNIRGDGTRLVVGSDAQANAGVWVVRLP